MSTARTISENRFGVEFDGIPAFKATKVNIGEDKHDPVKTKIGNNPRSLLGRGNVEQSETTVTIPSGLYDSSLRALQAWFDRYNDGVDTAPKTGRVITYDDTGRTPIETLELRDCVPISLKTDDKSADGNNTATMTLTVMPYQVKRI